MVWVQPACSPPCTSQELLVPIAVLNRQKQRTASVLDGNQLAFGTIRTRNQDPGNEGPRIRKLVAQILNTLSPKSESVANTIAEVLFGTIN